MIKLLLALIMMFAFGTSTVNAEENPTNIEDKISELAKTKSDNESAIKAKIDELSEDELKAVIANVNKLEEKNLDDLTIEEAAISKLEEMEGVETSNPLNVGKPSSLTIGAGILLLVLIFFTGLMAITGYSAESKYPFIIVVMIVLFFVGSNLL